MSAKKILTTAMMMQVVQIREDLTIVPVTLAMRVMDSTALVRFLAKFEIYHLHSVSRT